MVFCEGKNIIFAHAHDLHVRLMEIFGRKLT